jgi:hypothetical protein
MSPNACYILGASSSPRPREQEGVINYPAQELSLCYAITDARYTTTTEARARGGRPAALRCPLRPLPDGGTI